MPDPPDRRSRIEVTELRSVPDAPRFSLTGWHVRRSRVGLNVGLTFAASTDPRSDKGLVTFNRAVQLDTPLESSVLDVQGPKEALGRLLELDGMTVSSSAIADNGTLIIAFEDGLTLSCEPHPCYEAWEWRGLREWVVCQAGGEISVRR